MTAEAREILSAAAQFEREHGPANVLESVHVPSRLWPATAEAQPLVPAVRFVHEPEFDGMLLVARDPDALN